MAIGLNDFKLVANKSKSYYKFLERENKELENLEENQKLRLGFYFFALECLTDDKDILELLPKMNDSEFLDLFYHESNDDLGIDAVDIDDENKCIKLFNFKYRENFKREMGVGLNDAIISEKFLTAIQTNNKRGLTDKTKGFVEKIQERLDSKDVWELKLILVTNAKQNVYETDGSIERLEEKYSLEVETYSLEDWCNFILERPNPINATLLIDSNSVLTFEESTFSSNKSYIVRISMGDLIRITNKNEKLRQNHSLTDLKELSEAEIELSVLFDNVRGYLGEKVTINKNVLNTLETKPNKFFLYNNGITMIARDIIGSEVNANKKVKLELKDFQIVNGGQTLRNIYSFNKKNIDIEAYNNVQILVRIFKTGENEQLTSEIAEYTNSQNTISEANLRSITTLQRKIEASLREDKILYVRKVGDTGEVDTKYRYRISMEKFGQILYSYQGNPGKASNQKKKIFGEYYKDIFEKNFKMDEAKMLIEKYFEIKGIYENKANSYINTEQKYFYIIYLNLTKKIKNINKCIEILEETLEEYGPDKQLAPARKLIQNNFKLEIDKKVETYKRNKEAK